MQSKDIIRLKLFIKQCKEDSEIESITDLIMKYGISFPRYIKQYVDEYENEDKSYTYMITFTINEKKYDVKSKDLHNEIEEYIIGFGEQRKPQRCDLVKEGTDEDHKNTHWHLGLKTKKYIDFSNFLKFYRKKYGIVDVSKSWSNDYNNILIYINKSIPSQKIV